MSDLGERLERLGLAQYLDVFESEGFDSWDTVLDITESDLNALNVKLGHRRKLQRAIAESRGHSVGRPLLAPLTNTAHPDVYKDDDSAPESKGEKDSSASITAATNHKRKYRRHPKPDEHAPDRPPSAYVIFSNQVRETLKGQELTFTEIAKIVGERWQVLPAEAREACERQASAAKERYYAQLAEYKKTTHYENYQKYLEEFKAKHTVQQKEGKRSKLERGASIGSNHDQTIRTKKFDSGQVDSLATRSYPLESSPVAGPNTFSSAPLYSPQVTSPSISSPRLADQLSYPSASPRSASLHQEGLYDNASGRDTRGQPDTLSFQHTAYRQSQADPSAYFSQYRTAPGEQASRRSYREPMRLPKLSKEDSLSSGSSAASYLPLVGGPKSNRVLPQPVPSVGLASSAADRPPIASPPPPPPHHDYGGSSRLEALVRAGELARVAHGEATQKDNPT